MCTYFQPCSAIAKCTYTPGKIRPNVYVREVTFGLKIDENVRRQVSRANKERWWSEISWSLTLTPSFNFKYLYSCILVDHLGIPYQRQAQIPRRHNDKQVRGRRRQRFRRVPKVSSAIQCSEQIDELNSWDAAAGSPLGGGSGTHALTWTSSGPRRRHQACRDWTPVKGVTGLRWPENPTTSRARC